MTTYIANHRIERRIDGSPEITEPGETVELTDAERADLPEGALRLPTAVSPSDDAELETELPIDEGLTVAEIKDQAKDADLETLTAMLAAEKAGKNRSTAVKGIEDAIDALADEAGEDEDAPVEEAL